jgi:hypothetical protein
MPQTRQRKTLVPAAGAEARPADAIPQFEMALAINRGSDERCPFYFDLTFFPWLLSVIMLGIEIGCMYEACQGIPYGWLLPAGRVQAASMR